ncbi:MAG: SulP family inorganic anion transporter [Candidatus Sumerlaeota bacterium]|nr:SulP family inorganic anion transporter [Candidatus Sumerlaeota bacterium]
MSSSTLKADFVAGLTVAMVLIPQSVAYASLAGLPAYYGLYAAFIPPAIAALFGSSRHLTTGPMTIASLLSAAALASLASPGSNTYIAYAILLSLVAGVVQLGLGVLRLGMVVNFLSVPVVNAYINAAAIVIAMVQLPELFGITVDSSQYPLLTVFHLARTAAAYTHWPTLALGCLTVGIVLGLRRLSPKIPNVLAAVAIATLIAWTTGFDRNGQAPIEAIRSQEAVEAVAGLKNAQTEFERLTEERAALAPRVREAQQRQGRFSSEAADLQHQIDLFDIRAGQLKEEIQAYRRHLRGFEFVATEAPDGSMAFYPPGEVPIGQKRAPGMWRLQLERGPVDESALALASGGAVVGYIPRSLPRFQPPTWDLFVAMELLPMAIVIALLGYLESMSIAKTMATRTAQRLDPNQELIGQGLAKIVGAWFQSYPVTGSITRSIVNLEAGAKTGMSSVFASVAVGATLLFFTPLFNHVPESALAAVVLVSVAGLINVRGAIHSWQVSASQGLIGLITFAVTVIFAPHLEIGLVVGVLLSLGLHLYGRMRPYVAILSRHPDGRFRDAERNGLATCPYIAVIRFDGSLFFANTSFLEDRILDRLAAMPELRYVAIVCDGMNDIDASGVDMLSRQVDQLRAAGHDLFLCGLRGALMDVLRRTRLCHKLGDDHIFTNLRYALRAIHAKAHEGKEEKECPLIHVVHARAAREPHGKSDKNLNGEGGNVAR